MTRTWPISCHVWASLHMCRCRGWHKLQANFGGPFTYNLLGEILLILNMRYINLSLMVCICLLSLFSAGYSLILYRRTQQGQAGNICNLFSSFTTREYVLLVMHI